MSWITKKDLFNKIIELERELTQLKNNVKDLGTEQKVWYTYEPSPWAITDAGSSAPTFLCRNSQHLNNNGIVLHKKQFVTQVPVHEMHLVPKRSKK